MLGSKKVAYNPAEMEQPELSLSFTPQQSTKSDSEHKSSIKNSYEKKRLLRIKENQTALANLGVDSGFTLKGLAKSDVRMHRHKKVNLKGKAQKCTQKRVPKRRSRRVRGLQPDQEYLTRNNKLKENEVPDDEVEEENDEMIMQRWQNHVEAKKKLKCMDDKARRLFLVPTGVPGVNDHTLEEIVPEIGTYVWGFCEGLFSRIFQKVRPGDIFLFTSSGGGIFNKIAKVRSTKIVPKALADKFWSRMAFSMGGCSKSNIGFPLLCLLEKPEVIDWDKIEVMRLLGYKDHLQSSRYISLESLLANIGLSNATGQVVFKRCLRTLNLSLDRSVEEISQEMAQA